MKLPTLWCLITLLGSGIGARADLDESQFASYQEEDVLGQGGWTVQGRNDEGGYSDTADRATIEAADGGRYMRILPGYGGYEQTRLIKTFEPTTPPKAQVRMSYRPGSRSIGARIYFQDSQTKVDFSLAFEPRGIAISAPNSKERLNAEVDFEVLEWNTISLEIDFEAHSVVIRSGEQRSRAFPLPADLQVIDRIVIFGGGPASETGLADLKVESVQDFQ